MVLPEAVSRRAEIDPTDFAAVDTLMSSVLVAAVMASFVDLADSGHVVVLHVR